MDKLKRSAMGAAACFIYSFGIAWSLIKCHYIDFLLPFPAVLAVIFIAVIIMSLICYNIFTVAGTVLATLLTTLYIDLFRREEALFVFGKVLRPMASEISAFLMGFGGISDSSGLILALIFCILPVFLTVPFFKHGRGAVFLVPASAVVFAAEWHLGHFGIIPYAAITAAGLIMNSALAAHKPRPYFTLREMLSPGVPAPVVKPSHSYPGRAFRAVYALAAAPIILVFSYFLSDFAGFSMPSLFEGVLPVLPGSPYSFYSENPAFVSAAVGYNQYSSRLGGQLSRRSAPVFELTGNPVTSFLRGSVYDSYEGDRWINTFPSQKYAFDTGENPELFNKAFFPERDSVSLYPDIVSYSGTYIIRLLTPGYTKLFLAGAPVSGGVNAGRYGLTHNETGEIFTSFFMGTGDGYEITSSGWGYRGSVQNFLEINSPPVEKLPDGWDRYLAVPDNIKDELRAITEGIINNPLYSSDYYFWFDSADYSDMIKTYILLDYFRHPESGFSYTLSPPETPEDEDFTLHFLETGKGYCTYYATAMTLMLRSVDIPARYVEGYKPDLSAGDTVVVTTDSAHAWVEVFFEGFGWQPLDPTVGSGSAESIYQSIPLSELFPYEEEILPEEETPSPTPEDPMLSPTPGQNSPSPTAPTDAGDDGDTPGTEDREPIPMFVWFIIALLVSGTAYVLLTVHIRRYLISPGRLNRTFPSARNRVLYCYRSIKRNLTFLGFPSMCGETVMDYTIRAASELSDNDLIKAGKVVCLAVYSNAEISGESVVLCADTALRLERLALDKSWVKYFLRIPANIKK